MFSKCELGVNKPQPNLSIVLRWSILGPLCFLKQHHNQTSEQHKEIMLVFSQLQFGVLQTFLTAKKQREEKNQDSEIEPGEVRRLMNCCVGF